MKRLILIAVLLSLAGCGSICQKEAEKDTTLSCDLRWPNGYCSQWSRNVDLLTRERR